MGNYELLKAAINEVIKANGRQEITGEVLNQVLLSMVNSLGAGYQCMGVATPSTNPGTPDQNVFYFATQAGTYTNFDAIVLQAGISVLIWDGDWASQTWFTVDSAPTNNSQNLIASGAVFNTLKLDGGAYDVTAHNSGATFASLSALLNSANLNTLIPTEIRHGGMSIKFVQSSDNKYVQYRLMNQNWSTVVTDWQGVDDEPIAGSNNLVKSGGVANEFNQREGITTADFSVADENNKEIVRFAGGGIQTKNFDSKTTPSIISDTNDLSFKDDNGNTLVQFHYGHIDTKNFSSRKVEQRYQEELQKERDAKFVYCIGDSITAGAGAQNNYDGTSIPIGNRKNYPKRLEILNPDYKFEKYGMLAYGGEKIEEIMARVGVEPFCTKYEYTLPADTTPVSIEIISSLGSVINLNFQVQNNESARNPVEIAGILCQFNIVSDGVYTINRIESGTSIKIPAQTPIIPKFSTYTPKGLIIFCGTNNVLDFDINRYIKCIKDADSYYHTNGKFVCLSPFSINEHNTLAQREEEEGELLKAFGCRYINIRKYLSTQAIYDALDRGYIVGNYPTSEDLEKMSAGTAPVTLMSDIVHPNSQGYQIIADKINEVINFLNIV